MLQNIRRAQSGLAERREEAHQNNRKAAEAGFTLIELLIVIVILGILAAVVVFSVQGITDRGDKAACETTASTITSAAQAFYAKSNPGAYPADIQALIDANLLAANASATPTGVTYDKTTGTATCTL